MLLEEIRCIGCGALLQTKDPKKPGFIKEEVLEKRDLNDCLCLRCHNIQNYNKNAKVDVEANEYFEIVKNLIKKDCLIVNVVDVFDFNSTFIPFLNQYTNKNDLLIVGNKIDLYPKSIKHKKITDWMRLQINKAGFKIKDCILVSGKTGYNIEQLVRLIEKYRNKKDVYIVGTSNVGKSSIINAILRKYTDLQRDLVTTSVVPGTTLNAIRIPFFQDHKAIIDTPGLINPSQMTNMLSVEDLKYVLPKKEIKARIYQLDANQTVFIGGLASFSFVEGEHQPFVFYFSDQLKLHRTKYENKDSLYERQAGKLLVPPFDKKIDFELTSILITEPKEIVISGLGFIVCKKPCKLEIATLKKVKVIVRDCLI